MFGNLYERALVGERCWIRHDDGTRQRLPVHNWLGGRRADRQFDRAVLALCHGPTIDLGCGPGRLVADLIRRGVPALGVDQSATAVELARRSGAPALRRDVFDPLPAPAGGRRYCWPTATSGSVVTRSGCCAAPPTCSGAADRASPNSTRPHAESRRSGCGWNRRGRSDRGSGGPRWGWTARNASPVTPA